MIDPLDVSTLKAAREAAGLSVAQLAQKTGVHKATIYRVEAGQLDPTVKNVWSKLVAAVRRKK